MVDCRECKSRYRVDHLFAEMSEKKLRNISKASNLEAALAKTMNMQSQDFSKDKLAEILLSMVEDNSSLFESLVDQELISCPNCGRMRTLTAPRNFNLMFETHIGPVKDDSNAVYLRPETAQGIFVNFLNVMQSSRQRVPFGICQIGKSFRMRSTRRTSSSGHASSSRWRCSSSASVAPTRSSLTNGMKPAGIGGAPSACQK